MPEPITRVYSSRADADAAATALKEAGFGEVQAFGGDADAMAQDAVAASMRQAGVPAGAAAALAASVAQGRSVVAVDAPFGRAGRAEAILDSHNPIAVQMPAAATVAREASGSAALDEGPMGDATPFSTRMGWKLLSKSATPFSDWMGWRVLSDRKLPFNAYWGWPTLSSKKYMGWFGDKFLTDEKTPFSNRVGWKLLSDNATPFSSRFNQKVLSDEPTPFSTRFNFRLLTDTKYPLSSRFGWKLLSDKPGPI